MRRRWQTKVRSSVKRHCKIRAVLQWRIHYGALSRRSPTFWNSNFFFILRRFIYTSPLASRTVTGSARVTAYIIYNICTLYAIMFPAYRKVTIRFTNVHSASEKTRYYFRRDWLYPPTWQHTNRVVRTITTSIHKHIYVCVCVCIEREKKADNFFLPLISTSSSVKRRTLIVFNVSP